MELRENLWLWKPVCFGLSSILFRIVKNRIGIVIIYEIF